MTPQGWPQAVWAAPTVLGGIDTSGLALIHPRREGRRLPQRGRPGLSTHRWMVGGTLCRVLHQYGRGVGGDCATAPVPEKTLQWVMRQGDGRMMILSDTAFHAPKGDPATLPLGRRGEWHDRIRVETVWSRLTGVWHVKQVMHRGRAYGHARLAFTRAVFSGLGQWHGFQP